MKSRAMFSSLTIVERDDVMILGKLLNICTKQMFDD